MRPCDSVCQNCCRMQGICVVGGCSNTGYVGQSIPVHSIPLSDETRPETRKRPKKWADLCEAKAGDPSRISSISGSPLL